MCINCDTYRSFTEFFTMFFDEDKTGFTTLTNIMNAFYKRVEVKLLLNTFIYLWVNSMIEFENVKYAEILRLFLNHEDYPGRGMSVESLADLLNVISKSLLF